MFHSKWSRTVLLINLVLILLALPVRIQAEEDEGGPEGGADGGGSPGLIDVITNFFKLYGQIKMLRLQERGIDSLGTNMGRLWKKHEHKFGHALGKLVPGMKKYLYDDDEGPHRRHGRHPHVRHPHDVRHPYVPHPHKRHPHDVRHPYVPHPHKRHPHDVRHPYVPHPHKRHPHDVRHPYVPHPHKRHPHDVRHPYLRHPHKRHPYLRHPHVRHPHRCGPFGCQQPSIHRDKFGFRLPSNKYTVIDKYGNTHTHYHEHYYYDQFGRKLPPRPPFYHEHNNRH